MKGTVSGGGASKGMIRAASPIWTNPNSSVEFEAKTINIANASKYSLLEIVFRPTSQSNITDNTYITQIIDTSHAKSKLSFSGFIDAQSISNRACGAYRNLTVSVNSITFEAGTRVLFTGSTFSDTYAIVPTEIYGITAK